MISHLSDVTVRFPGSNDGVLQSKYEGADLPVGNAILTGLKDRKDDISAPRPTKNFSVLPEKIHQAAADGSDRSLNTGTPTVLKNFAAINSPGNLPERLPAIRLSAPLPPERRIASPPEPRIASRLSLSPSKTPPARLRPLPYVKFPLRLENNPSEAQVHPARYAVYYEPRSGANDKILLDRTPPPVTQDEQEMRKQISVFEHHQKNLGTVGTNNPTIDGSRYVIYLGQKTVLTEDDIKRDKPGWQVIAERLGWLGTTRRFLRA